MREILPRPSDTEYNRITRSEACHLKSGERLIETWFYIISIAITLSLTWMEAREILIQRRLKRKGVRTTGTVTASRHSAGARENYAIQDIEFRDACSVLHHFRYKTQGSYFIEGAIIDVYYLPENPKVARPAERRLTKYYIMLLFSVAVTGSFIWGSVR